MKFNEFYKKTIEEKIDGDEFIANLGDEDEINNFYADRTKNEVKKMILDAWQEYIDEAEHQDGLEYWREFPGTEETFKDFIRYVAFDRFEDLHEL